MKGKIMKMAQEVAEPPRVPPGLGPLLSSLPPLSPHTE